MTQLADVLVPPNAEGTRATVLRWCKQVGDTVAKDEPLVELETDKVTVEIPAPADGTLFEILKQANAEVIPDDVLARLSLGGATAQRQQAASTPPDETEPSTVAETSQPEPAVARQALSPSVRRLLKEHSMTAADIEGSGRDGRVTAQDVIRHAASATRIPHSAIRRRVAEHMARSMLEAPHVTTLFEADLTRVLTHRSRHAADFESQGTRLTLTAYFVSACARALRDNPEVNATFHTDALELHADVNIGVGTALGNKGLIVPVIHRAQHLSLFGVAQRLGYLVDAARGGKLAPEDVRGGTFTISNHGVGGSLLAAPIVINQPQVAILGVGKVERRVCAIQVDGTEAIGVRSRCYLTLTIDHRALDAFQANAFLSGVIATLENWPAAEEA
ncbi:MAG TPA: 2-oxo acid dehydrogenase subunit E2 [Steroidobacteraceae bacterium]|jgi:2-oxoglutarate dehydrogenase E2 component (dihydrolipoamide succinyltransferase)|nr:2-oxo acid dehydrogenase subunit E2 [Steroidobacteraceae bacterium]